jgi:hypothetical protein
MGRRSPGAAGKTDRNKTDGELGGRVNVSERKRKGLMYGESDS